MRALASKTSHIAVNTIETSSSMLDVKRSRIEKPVAGKGRSKPITKSSTKNKSKLSSTALSKALDTTSTTISDRQPSESAPKPSTTTMTSSSTNSSTPTQEDITTLLKPLASSEPSKRRHALTHLLALISAPETEFTPTQLQQIHRALYVSLYMHDSKSAVSVQNWARSLASTLRMFYKRDLAVRKANAGRKPEEDETEFPQTVAWAMAFWEEIAREWLTIDQWRMNKVLLLVRFWIAEGFSIVLEMAHLKSEEGDEEDTGVELVDDSWKDFLADVLALPLEATRALPDGLRMHVLDVWGDQLEAFNEAESAEAEEERRKELARMLLQPVKELSVFHKDDQEVPNMPKNVRTRAKEVIKRAEA